MPGYIRFQHAAQDIENIKPGDFAALVGLCLDHHKQGQARQFADVMPVAIPASWRNCACLGAILRCMSRLISGLRLNLVAIYKRYCCLATCNPASIR